MKARRQFSLQQVMNPEHYVWFVCISGLALIYFYFLSQRSQEHRTDNFTIKELLLLVTLGTIGILIPVGTYTPGFADPMFGPAVLVYIACAAILYSAMSTLGPVFSPSLQIAKEHKLITTGIYGYMRHPMYTAAFLMLLGQSLLFPSVVGWVAAALAFALLVVVRIPNEEAMMVETFGEEYMEYRERVRSLL